MDDTAAGTLMEVAKAAGEHQYLPTTSDTAANHVLADDMPVPSGSTEHQAQPNAKNSRKRKAKQDPPSTDDSQASANPQQHEPHQQPHPHQQPLQADEADDGAAAQAAAAAAAVAASAYLQRESDEQQHHTHPHAGQQHNMYAPPIDDAYQEGPGTAHAHAPAVSSDGEAGPSSQQAGASPPAQGESTSPGRNARPLSSTKRAAQNRAAQRAFRERRDRHVKDLEVRAAQYETLQAVYTDLQARYNEALTVIEQLKAENNALRGIHAQGDGEAMSADLVGAADRAAAFAAANQQQQQHPNDELSHVQAAAAAAAHQAGIGLDAVASAAAGAARLHPKNGADQVLGAAIDPSGASLASLGTINKLLPDCSFDDKRPSLRFDAESDAPLVPLFTRRCPWLPAPNILHFVPLSLHASSDHLERFTEWQKSPRVEKGWKQAWSQDKQREYISSAQASPDRLGLVGYWSDSEDTLGQPWGYVEAYWVKDSNLAPFYDFAPQTLGFHALVGEERFRGPNRVRAWMPSVVYMLLNFEPRCDLVVSEPDITNTKMVDYECECGGEVEKPVDLPHKRAAMVFFRKDDFLSRTWPLGPRREEGAGAGAS